MNLSKLWEIGKDRGAWCAAVHRVAKSHTGLSNWTTGGSCERGNSVWVSLLISDRAGVETHEEGWGAAAWPWYQDDCCHAHSQGLHTQRGPHVSGIPSQRRPKWGVYWADLGTVANISVQRNSLNTCRRWLFTLCLNTYTHTLSLSLSHISVYITRLATMVPCEGAFHCVCHHDCISSCFPCTTSFSSSVVFPPHCSICDLEFVSCSSLLWFCCDCSFCPVWLLSCFIIKDRCGSPPVPGAKAT